MLHATRPKTHHILLQIREKIPSLVSAQANPTQDTLQYSLIIIQTLISLVHIPKSIPDKSLILILPIQAKDLRTTIIPEMGLILTPRTTLVMQDLKTTDKLAVVQAIIPQASLFSKDMTLEAFIRNLRTNKEVSTSLRSLAVIEEASSLMKGAAIQECLYRRRRLRI